MVQLRRGGADSGGSGRAQVILMYTSSDPANRLIPDILRVGLNFRFAYGEVYGLVSNHEQFPSKYLGHPFPQPR